MRPIAAVLALSMTAASLAAPTTRPSIDTDAIRSIIGGEEKMTHGVWTVTVPRDDLDVVIDGMAVPTAAGLTSTFWFYRCPCGRMRMIGQIAACDYEADDVAAAIHKNATADADVRVDAIAPMLSGEKPAMRIVRIEGEGTETALAGCVKAALDCTGDARHAKSTTMPADRPVSGEKP